MHHDNFPVTLVTSRLVRAGHEEEFAGWADRLDEAVGQMPGARGTLRLDQPAGLHHFIHRFDSEIALEQWRASPDHRSLTAEADAYSVGCAQVTTGEHRQASLPSEATAPKWKTWLATWVTVFPLLLLLNMTVRSVGAGLPQPVQLGLTSLIMTAALTWYILPRIRKLLRPWLFGDEQGGLRRDPG